ncbi:MAG: flagellar hook-length control protein FliK, partial [Leifsonia sp.]
EPLAPADDSASGADEAPAVALPTEPTLKHASADPTAHAVAAPSATGHIATAAPALAPAAPPAPTPAAAVPLTEQIARPLLALATAPDGEHTLTLTVTPDNLGPVTVRAHVAGEHLRIELFAPNDASRDAVKQILTDLRRDLASQGLGAELDLSGKNQPDSGERAGSHRHPTHEPGTRGRQFEAEHRSRQPVGGPTSLLDVLA